MILQVRVKGRPVPKPRMTQRDRWQHRPAVERYRSYVDTIRAAIIDAKRSAGKSDFFSIDGPVRVKITFEADETHITIAPEDRPGYGRPTGIQADADNLLKGLLDAMQPQAGRFGSSIIRNDKQVVALEVAFRDIGSVAEGPRPPVKPL